MYVAPLSALLYESGLLKMPLAFVHLPVWQMPNGCFPALGGGLER